MDKVSLRQERVWVGFGMMCGGMFMALLDTQVVVTSLPTIQLALHIPRDEMSWIQTAYLIAEIISIPLTGLLMRAFGMRWLFVMAVSFFTLASIGCAQSTGFASLIGWRICQGLSGGALVPLVFAAVFLLFPPERQVMATTIASVLAVLAPTVGPLVGGWVTETFAWPWLFLINVVPGICAAIGGLFSLPKAPLRLELFRHLDVGALLSGTGALAALEIAIKEAPTRGWASPLVSTLLLSFVIAALFFVVRTARAPNPLVDMSAFRNRNFSIGCALSFMIGIGLYSSIYLMPIFLAYVRDHNALEIGEIMLVTGVAQLACAPIVAMLLKHVDARILSAIGFLILSVGAALSADQSRLTDFKGMLGGQLVRGCAFMFCVLPPTELALGKLDAAIIPDASGLFNLMRNLGGAVGIALADSIIFTRAPGHGQALYNSLVAGDSGTLASLGITQDILMQAAADPAKRPAIESVLRKVAFADAINDAWFALSICSIAIIAVLLFAERTRAVSKISALSPGGA